jgi:hypothetical protein
LSNADRSPGIWGRLHWVGLAALVAALGLCLMPGVADAAKKKKKKDTVKVLSQNLYIGFDLQDFLEPALAGDVAALTDAAGAALRDVQTNDFAVRARTIAQQIKKNKVDLAGLQEAALYRLEIPTDGGAPSILNPTGTYALVPLIDYLDTLVDELNKKAQSKKQCERFKQKRPGKECYRGYKLVGLGTNVTLDAENPADLDLNDGTGVDIPPDNPRLFGIDADVRLTVRDALIVRKGAGIKLANTKGQSFSPSNTIGLELLGGAQTIGIERGWVSTDANVRGMKFRLVNTHMEDLEDGTFREDQASELVAAGGPASVPKTVLIGDLNSDPSIAPGPDLVNDNSESNIAFNRIAAAGFSPVSGPGLTHGHQAILNNPNDNTFTKRIDWIMTNSPSIRMRKSFVLNRFANGLWASDHGGVLSVLDIPGGKKK